MTAVVAYLLAGVLWLLWAWLTAAPLRPRDEPELSAPQIALLRVRGRRAALIAAVTELYAAGLVVVGRRGQLRRRDVAVPAGLSELARAVYRTLVLPRSLGSVALRAPVRAALRAAAGELARCGAAPSPRRSRWSRLALLSIVVVSLLGVTRAGALPPPLVLPAPLLVLAAVAAWFAPRRTVAGTRLLRRLRREHADRWADRSRLPASSGTAAQVARASAVSGTVAPGLEALLRHGPWYPVTVDFPTGSDDGASAYGDGA